MLRYTVQVLLVIAITAINVAALLLFLFTIHRIFGSSAQDLNAMLALSLSVIATVPFWRASRFLVSLNASSVELEPGKRKRLILVGNSAFLLITFILFKSLPAVSDFFYAAGSKAHTSMHLSKAIDRYERALYQLPERADVHFALGNLYESLVQYDLAAEHYWLAIRNDEPPFVIDFAAYNNLARFYLKAHKYDDALVLLHLAMKKNTENVSDTSQSFGTREGIIYKNIALAHLGLDEFGAAMENAKAAHNSLYHAGTWKKHPSIQCIYAIAANGLGEKNEALITKEACVGKENEYTGIERALMYRAKSEI